MSEEEQPDNQHEVEGIEGRQRGGVLQRVEVGWWLLWEGSSINMIDCIF